MAKDKQFAEAQRVVRKYESVVAEEATLSADVQDMEQDLKSCVASIKRTKARIQMLEQKIAVGIPTLEQLRKYKRENRRGYNESRWFIEKFNKHLRKIVKIQQQISSARKWFNITHQPEV